MKSHIKPIDPDHKTKRRFFRVAGLSILAVGIALLIIGMVDFFSASFGGPKYFWGNFIALPLIFVGASLTSMGYMGSMARYSAQEMAPVASDTFNYVAEETKTGVETLVRAIKDGIDDQETMPCPDCHKANPKDAAFCNGCGSSLDQEKACTRCATKNSQGASFCNGCGAKLI